MVHMFTVYTQITTFRHIYDIKLSNSFQYLLALWVCITTYKIACTISTHFEDQSSFITAETRIVKITKVHQKLGLLMVQTRQDMHTSDMSCFDQGEQQTRSLQTFFPSFSPPVTYGLQLRILYPNGLTINNEYQIYVITTKPESYLMDSHTTGTLTITTESSPVISQEAFPFS